MLKSVVTLALGLWPRQGLARLQAKREAQESHLMLMAVQKSVREWTITLLSELPFSEDDCRGQNRLDWRILYIIEKLLKRKFVKWAHMTHLDIWNISYGQKKGRESNWQFDF
jgi:hypothetical protein